MERSVILVSLVLVVTFFQITEQRRPRGQWGNHHRVSTSDSSNTNDGCSRFRCWKECTHGFMNDSRGCQICACARDPNADPCPAIECPDTTHRCRFGYRTDENDCATCECREFNRTREACTPVQCTLECPDGFLTDRRGCDICRCKSAAYRRTSCRRPARCRNECAFGRATDRRGCPSCTCNPQPVETEDAEEPTVS